MRWLAWAGRVNLASLVGGRAYSCCGKSHPLAYPGQFSADAGAMCAALAGFSRPLAAGLAAASSAVRRHHAGRIFYLDDPLPPPRPTVDVYLGALALHMADS